MNLWILTNKGRPTISDSDWLCMVVNVFTYWALICHEFPNVQLGLVFFRHFSTHTIVSMFIIINFGIRNLGSSCRYVLHQCCKRGSRVICHVIVYIQCVLFTCYMCVS